MIETVPITITCAGCSISRAVKPTPKGEACTPTGWKKLGDVTYCPQCWRKKYILRAITMPVASPLDCSWDELRKALRTMWAQTTAVLEEIGEGTKMADHLSPVFRPAFPSSAIISERSSPSRVRFAAPNNGAPLTAPGRSGKHF